ncbi:MAG TPA: 3-deoxy-7-phosphoheptulonate synthase, partial [Ktedonobacteraceae bacterium]|nr:3-deoxy-7-phosphoheptulonate synthase [Ktedonobacteraceae bacterium]
SIVVGDALGSRPVVIGKGTSTIMASPYAVATREHLLAPAHVGQATGAFKPHTSPSQFQGRGVAGLQLLAEARNATGLPSITAVIEPGAVETLVASADGLQIGSRTRHHFPLLVAAGQHRSVRPVLLMRWLSVTIPAGRLSAASMLAASHFTVIFCECGRHGLDRKPVSYA